jgi:hypothetical protein
MRFTPALLLLMAVALFTQSCKKNDKDCAFLAPRLILINFSEAASDTVIIRKYAPATGFSQLIDTVRIAKANLTYTLIGKDSSVLNTNNKSFNEQFYLYDWRLVIPGASKTIEITDVKATFGKQEEKGEECHSYVNSMMLDSKLYKYTTWLPDTYRAYVTN